MTLKNSQKVTTNPFDPGMLIIVGQITSNFRWNRAYGDTSTKFGMMVPKARKGIHAE